MAGREGASASLPRRPAEADAATAEVVLPRLVLLGDADHHPVFDAPAAGAFDRHRAVKSLLLGQRNDPIDERAHLRREIFAPDLHQLGRRFGSVLAITASNRR